MKYQKKRFGNLPSSILYPKNQVWVVTNASCIFGFKKRYPLIQDSTPHTKARLRSPSDNWNTQDISCHMT